MTKFFVLDTNVLISSAILKESVSRKAYEKARLVGSIVRSDETLEELATQLVKSKFDKYLLAQEKVLVISHFKRDSILVEPKIKIIACRDADDDKFLSLGVATGASCIVTGDGALQELHPFRSIPIVSPADFLKMF
jgi:putative PIN family toxin of toxin-antitoxin system